MLFFRSEERVTDWCAAHTIPQRPVVGMDQLWEMATAWYANRLEPDARRPGPDAIRGIFDRIGLRGDFWDPQADHFE